MLASAALVVHAAGRILERLGIDLMPALLWAGVAEWGPEEAPRAPFRQRFEDGLVELASGAAPADRVRHGLTAVAALLAGAVEAASARRLGA